MTLAPALLVCAGLLQGCAGVAVTRGPESVAGPVVKSAARARSPAGAAASPLPTRPFDAEAFGRALVQVRDAAPRPMPGVRLVIVPHHWPAGRMIVGTLRDAAAARTSETGSRPWRRVVLLAPDHRKAGARVAVTTGRPWASPFGTVAGDARNAGRLVRSGLVVDDADLMALEHAVSGLVPAVAHAFPGASVLPVAVRGDARASECRRLAQAVTPLVAPDTLVVVSADFAHDVPPREARSNDLESLAALRALDAGAILAYGDEHVDARGALATAVYVARELRATRFVALERSDGSELAGYGGGPVTSYVTGYYAVAE